jgi:general secretion pathway protein E
MDNGSLKFMRMPDGTIRITESALIDFLTDQGIDLGEVLSKAGYTEVTTTIETAESQPDPAATESPSPPAETQPPSVKPIDHEPVRQAEPPPRQSPAYESLPGPLETKPDQFADQNLRAAQICDAVLTDAAGRGAQTVHLDPHGGRLLLRLRIDGVLRNKPNFDRNLTSAMQREIVEHLLKLADTQIDPDKITIPIDSGFTMTINEREMALHLSAVPTADGIRLVIHMPSEPADLGLLELENSARANLEKLLQSGGLIVVASKRRTGRDSALQALLTASNMSGTSVLTIGPDCVADIDTISHLRLDPAAGLTYGAASGAIKRQDADTVVLTELRDPTTAWNAFEAAHDGALVIAGANVDSACDAITELRTMGIEPWPLGGTLKAVIEQASVSALCEQCRLRLDESSYEAVGCDQCGGTGWAGTTILTGIVFVDGRLAELIRAGASSAQVSCEIADSSPWSLANIAQNAVELGVTTRDQAAGLFL